MCGHPLWMAPKGREFYFRSIKSWLQDNDIEMHSTRYKGKFAVAERYIRTLKNKTCKYMVLTLKKFILIN